jgi:hypothetical protein
MSRSWSISPGSGTVSRYVSTFKDTEKKLKKKYRGKKVYIFLIKNCNLLIPRPPYRIFKLHEKPSALKREHPARQKKKIINFFLFLWDIFAPH